MSMYFGYDLHSQPFSSFHDLGAPIAHKLHDGRDERHTPNRRHGVWVKISGCSHTNDLNHFLKMKKKMLVHYFLTCEIR